jgi:hypothetical protein
MGHRRSRSSNRVRPSDHRRWPARRAQWPTGGGGRAQATPRPARPIRHRICRKCRVQSWPYRTRHGGAHQALHGERAGKASLTAPERSVLGSARFRLNRTRPAIPRFPSRRLIPPALEITLTARRFDHIGRVVEATLARSLRGGFALAVASSRIGAVGESESRRLPWRPFHRRSAQISGLPSRFVLCTRVGSSPNTSSSRARLRECARLTTSRLNGASSSIIAGRLKWVAKPRGVPP